MTIAELQHGLYLLILEGWARSPTRASRRS